jgi:hypothetical protein
MTFTAISQHLRKQRLAEDKATADKAKAEYGVSFSEFFTYRRGSQMLVMSDPTSIAKHYRALQNAV